MSVVVYSSILVACGYDVQRKRTAFQPNTAARAIPIIAGMSQDKCWWMGSACSNITSGIVVVTLGTLGSLLMRLARH